MQALKCSIFSVKVTLIWSLTPFQAGTQNFSLETGSGLTLRIYIYIYNLCLILKSVL